MVAPHVGIDAIATHVPKLFVDMPTDFAASRFLDMGCSSREQLASKITNGIGIRKMSMTDAHEDPVTMAAMAVRALIEKTGIDPQDIGFLAVGTESGVDQSKSAAAYVLGILENYFDRPMRNCMAPQYQFACAGAMYGLESALNLFRSGEFSKKYAVVVATDIARYELKSPGESTQGAGAVALLISGNPRLLAFESRTLGSCTRDERDFFRPNWRKTAVVDGKYSTQVYLDVVQAAYEQSIARLREKPENEGKTLSELVPHIVCHVPFPKMAEYMASRFLPDILRSDASMPCDLPVPPKNPTTEQIREHEKSVRAHPTFQRAFQRTMADSLHFAGEVGNIYSGSLFLALASFLEQANPADIEGKRVLLCSYGSGATALVNSAIVQSGYAEAHAKFSLEEHLRSETKGGRRRQITMNEYEYLHGLQDVAPESTATQTKFMTRKSLVAPHDEFALVGFGEQDNNHGLRLYKYIR